MTLTSLPGINKRATLTLYNLNYTFTPLPMKDSIKVIPESRIDFFANYSNTSTGASVNASGVGCNISFDGSFTAMRFNSTLGLYSYNRSFENRLTRSYAHGYNVSCIGSSVGYENLNYSSSVDVVLNATLLSLAYNLEGMDEGAVS